ncbi:MAG: caspase family protein, partial [Aestuariivirgaceae bacterium]
FMLTIAILALTVPSGKTASAAERVALIIGNSAYQSAAELKNPRNDAEALANMLTGFGFLVLKGIDVDQFNFKTLVRAYTREIKDAKLALFFYAGHGLQVGRRNFLLPVDAELKDEADLDFETIEMNFIIQQMERKKRTNIILMDACRNNPFAANLARNMGTRSTSIGRGLAAVDTGVGTFVGFATQPGNVALDGESINSPFTKAIIKHLAEPGLDIGVLMRRVREEVIAETDGKQVPWSNSSLVGDSVVLNQTPRQIAVEPKTSPTPADGANAAGSSINSSNNGGTASIALELSYWNTIKSTNNPALLRSYLTQYPDGTFSGLAKAMIESLEKTTLAPPAKKQVKEPEKQKVAAIDPDPS